MIENSTHPVVSVVMSVFNSATTLAIAVDSILAQQGVAFELIVIDDGSTDGSGPILDDYARRDARVRVIHQENAGLTRALIRGCGAARGSYIARQDAGGDISLPERLVRQCHFLDQNPEVVMISCGTRFIGPQGEFLYDVVQRNNELMDGLNPAGSGQLRGPSSHPSTMFRRATYCSVGGYRSEFRVAQDLDLWVRLAEVGRCVAMPEVLYEATWQLGSISHLRRPQQVLAAKAITACRQRRKQGVSEQAILDGLASSMVDAEQGRTFLKGMSEARFHYFLGSLLARRDPIAARRYLRQAIRTWPWHVKAWAKLAALALRPAPGQSSPR